MSLLRLCRRWALFRVVCQMRIYLRYVHTLNHADGPSRNRPVGWNDSGDSRPKEDKKKAYRGIG